MSVYHFGQRPLLSLEIAQSQLPHDALWAAPGCHEFLSISEKQEGQFDPRQGQDK